MRDDWYCGQKSRHIGRLRPRFARSDFLRRVTARVLLVDRGNGRRIAANRTKRVRNLSQAQQAKTGGHNQDGPGKQAILLRWKHLQRA
jgi:hypothetical protein